MILSSRLTKSDLELIETCRNRHFRNRTDLYRQDPTLYRLLLHRGLLLEIFGPGRKPYHNTLTVVSDQTLLARARALKCSSRSELFRVNQGLYVALKCRRLLDKLYDSLLEIWCTRSDAELISAAKALKLKSRSQCARKHMGLYRVLQARKLLDQVFTVARAGRNWQSVSDEQCIQMARTTASRLGELSRRDPSLYNQLLKRGLTKVTFQKSQFDILSHGSEEVHREAQSLPLR